MAAGSHTVQVRHRVGPLGKAMIGLARFINIRFGLNLPMPIVVWAVNHSSYVRVDDGPWQKMRLDLTAGEFQ